MAKARQARHIPRWPLALGGALLVLIYSPQLVGIRPPLLLQMTPSLPRGVYWLRPLPATISRGLLVTFPVPPSVRSLVFANGWLPEHWYGAEVFLVKPVAAVAGDAVCVHADGVWINQVWVAPIAESWHGVALPILRGCWTLAPEELFLLSTTHPTNFDSRYFGSVLRTQLDREAIPIWTRE